MTTTVEQAETLVEVARRECRILQVGHLERFNAAVQAVQPILTVPRFIESARLAPFKHRGTEVDVVLDLMIHDIDLILSIVRSPVVSVDAIGSSVFSKEIDIANARLRFANGCVANATASRVSLKTERRLRLFQDDAYLSVDLHQKVLTVIRKGTAVGADGMPQVAIEETTYEQGDALMAEIEAFLGAAESGSAPPVTGEDGLVGAAHGRQHHRAGRQLHAPVRLMDLRCWRRRTSAREFLGKSRDGFLRCRVVRAFLRIAARAYPATIAPYCMATERNAVIGLNAVSLRPRDYPEGDATGGGGGGKVAPGRTSAWPDGEVVAGVGCIVPGALDNPEAAPPGSSVTVTRSTVEASLGEASGGYAGVLGVVKLYAMTDRPAQVPRATALSRTLKSHICDEELGPRYWPPP